MVVARSVAPWLPVFATLAFTLAACGSDGGSASRLDLSPAGEQGRQIAITNGCGSCHGQNGEGGVGPAFEGLYGTTVQLDDGASVVADEAYIIESIKDPNAKRVDGYELPMPQVNLSDDEIAALVAYIRDLSPSSTPTSQTSGTPDADTPTADTTGAP